MQASEPPGLVAISASAETASTVTSVVATSESSGLRFAYWTVNGAPQWDVAGCAANPVEFTILNASTATAHYVSLTSDTDTDLLPDWFELHYYGSLTGEATDDTDSDGFTTQTEYARDWHPGLFNNCRDGGVSSWQTEALIFIADTNYSLYTESSSPLGFVSSQQVESNGTAIISTNPVQDAFGYRFAYWTVNGVRVADATGKAVFQTAVVLTGGVSVVAYYVPLMNDVDADAVPDWFELQNFGTLTNDANSDFDGDGFSMETEYTRDWNPDLFNDSRDGGVSSWQSDQLLLIVNTNYSLYTESSSPPGLVGNQQVISNGTVVASTNPVQEAAGYRFAYWAVNGQRAADASGRALFQTAVSITSTASVVAHYIPLTNDVDADSVPDWFELQCFGLLTNDANSDADGDGFSMQTEYTRDWNPTLFNDSRDGGVSSWLSEPFVLDLQPFALVQAAFVNGIYQDFFSAGPPTNGLFSLDGNTAPALGDWDGDGDLDLFVCASSRTLRVYQNAGSPLVCNLIDRTSNFTAAVSVCTNFTSPYPTLGDWNSDGRTDLVIGGDQGFVCILDSTGTFASPQTPAVNYVLSVGSTSAIPAMADVNGDAYADLLILRPDGTVDVYTNSQDLVTPFTGGAAISNLLVIPVPSPTGLATIDADGDGQTDVLVSDATGSVWEFRRVSGPSFTLMSKVYAGTYAGFANRLTITASDFNGDGNPDLLGGFAEGGLVYLRNAAAKLSVAPPVATVVSGAAQSFQASNAAGAVSWTFVTNRSGGTLTAGGSYTSGPHASVVDVIEAKDATGQVGRAYVNVISPAGQGAIGKAIIIAGGKSLSDPVWAATEHIAGYAYNALRLRGYAKAQLQFQSFNTNVDVDGNGLRDDIAAASTRAHAADAFTNWAANSDRLFVYLADHGSDIGGAGFFRLNATETISAADLAAWLDHLQNTYQTEVTVVLDFCYAGSFVDELAYTGTASRVVIAATAPSQLTYFIASGLVSFSDIFFNGLAQGFSLNDAYRLAADAMSPYQTPMLDDNRDGLAQPGVDGAVAAGVHIGPSFVVGRDIPAIGRIMPSQPISNLTAVVWADDIASSYPLDRVWCSILPPSFAPGTNTQAPVVNVPEADLAPSLSAGRYEQQLQGLSQQGSYRVSFYARDIWGGISLPRQSVLTQTGFVEKAVVIAGGPTNDAKWAAIDMMSRAVFTMFRSRRLAGDQIQFLSASSGVDADGDGTNDVDAAVSLAAAGQAITNWAADAQRLSIYLVGSTTGTAFRLADGVALSATQLDAWVDELQASNCAVNVFMDFPGAGSYLTNLAAPASRERISISSTKPGQTAVWGNGGVLSFSRYFSTYVASGLAIGESYQRARRGMLTASGRTRQAAQIDDNGNGIPDQAGSDGILAAQRYIGSTFVTGDDIPLIGTVMDRTSLVRTASATIWCSGVSVATTASNVWCVLTPPDYDGIGELPETNLTWNAGAQRYEASYDGFTSPGSYALTFFAIDDSGQMSAPAQTFVNVADAYEPDDSETAASFMDVGDTQTNHTFHLTNDEDWIQFYLPTNGLVYELSATGYGPDLDLMLDLYYLQANGALSNIMSDVNDDGPGEAEVLGLDMQLDQLPEGYYLLRCRNVNSDVDEIDTGYCVSVIMPVGGGKLIVIAIDKLNPTQSPPGAVVTIDGGSPLSFNGNTSVSYSDVPAGSHQVRVTTAAGYLPSQDPALPGQPDNPANALYGNPKAKSLADNDWQSALFQFIPHLQAQGEAQDAWTGEKVAGAKIEFTARSGMISNLVYDGYPNNATYESLWYTLADGRFPTNVLLPTVNYDLKLSKAGYSNLVQGGAIVSPTPATTNDLGLKLLTPVDANGNAIADAWEDLYFSGPTTATNDADDDGHTDLEEYWAGTNPTNAGSLFRSDELDTTNGLTLRWPVSPGRVYRVLSTPSLVTGHWTPAAGPWTAAVGQASMEWTDGSLSTGLYYRIQAYTR